MLGCCKQAMASASVLKRARSSGPAWAPVRIIFSATTRPSFVCRAWYTTPMPPRPSSRMISYPGTEATVPAAAIESVGGSVSLSEIAGGGGRVRASPGTDGGRVGGSATTPAGGSVAVSDCAWGLGEVGWPAVAIGDLQGDGRTLSPRRGVARGEHSWCRSLTVPPRHGQDNNDPGRTRERRL